ncbi:MULTISPECIES: hypothetical protein [unclassified Acinetobacter]|nr:MULTISPECIES: hypothetical protein [unclassified Acinetobacter]SEM02311.1 hypothetical protein SAMN05216500_109113 [Acinetobacter sp. DSM 11652]
MSKSTNFATTLTVIYLALIAVCIAIYHLLIKFIPNHDYQSLAVDLLSWSATLFATIALLYTFNSWKEQKRYELSHSISSDIYTKSQNFRSNFTSVIIAIYAMHETKEIDESVKKVEHLITSYYDDLSESFTKLNYIFNDKNLTDKFMKLLKSVEALIDLINLAKMACCTDDNEKIIYEKIYDNKLQETFDNQYAQIQTLINNFTDNEDIYREALLKISLYKHV